MNKELFQTYSDFVWLALMAAGFNPRYNTETETEKAYKRAKEAIIKDFTKPDYVGMTFQEVERWEKTGGWTGWVLPHGLHGIDAEDPDTISLIDSYCQRDKITPSKFKSNNGFQYFFRTEQEMSGTQDQIVKAGFSVTYRAARKNYSILPDINGRTWIKPLNGNLPLLPEWLMPYDSKSLDDVLNALSWQVGNAYRAGMLGGYDEIDFPFMAYLDSKGISEEDKIRAFELVFLLDYDHRRTIQLLQRLKSRQEKEQKILGAGTFVKAVNDKVLEKVKLHMQELERITGHKHTVPEPWSDPIPLTDYSQLPQFPSEVLPGIGREIVETVSEVNQVDAGLTGSIYLPVLATCTAKKAEVDLKTHKEPLNIFTCSVLDSGERKTSTMSTMTAPLYLYQKDKTEEMADEIRQSYNRNKINEARLAKLQKQAALADTETERTKYKQDASELLKEIAEDPLIKPPLIAVDDITNEALGINMAENNERISIFSAEGGIFALIAGLYHEKGENFDIYLKGHAGDPWSSHRVGREQKHMKSPALTMCLAVQHDVLKEIGGHRRFRVRGMNARSLYSICRSQIGLRTRQHKSIDKTLLKAYQKHIESLMDLPLELHTFALDKEAHEMWDSFYNEIERDMLPGKPLEPIKDWGSKLAGAVARIAGLLHYSEHKAEAVRKPISVNSVNAACVIGAYYREHALAAFGLMQEDPRIEAAKKILEYINQHRPKKFKGRDVLRFKSAFKSKEDVLPGLKILVERQYIRESDREYSGMGRPESVSYEVNPKTL